jgi:hypothetical protein
MCMPFLLSDKREAHLPMRISLYDKSGAHFCMQVALYM